MLLGIIHRDYLCDETTKHQLLEEDRKQLEQLEFEKKEKYNPNNLFKKQINEKHETVQENALIEYKESIFKKLWEKVRYIFYKK